MTALAHRQFDLAARSAAEVRAWLGSVDYGRLLHEAARASGVPVIERFDWHGNAVDPGFRRIRVMARQAYVLSHAAIGGARGTERRAARAAAALIDHGLGPDGQFRCRLASDGAVLDATADLYDIAFGLFAMAWWYRLSGDERALAVAERSVSHLRAEMASPAGRGFVSRAGTAGRHEQNPHMHLFEAATFLAAFTGRASFRALADELFALAETTLFDAATGILPEHFDAQWRPAADGRVEPGHHYEWVWLLHRYALLASQPRAYDMADRLFAFAQRHGHDHATGLVLDAVDAKGRPVETDLRIWPNTELLKAQIALQERHGPAPGFDDAALAETVQRIREHFLTARLHGPAASLRPGWWIDHVHAGDLRPKSDHVPASTLYHIFFAFTELLRHRAGHDPFSGLPW